MSKTSHADGSLLSAPPSPGGEYEDGGNHLPVSGANSRRWYSVPWADGSWLWYNAFRQLCSISHF
ncbi:MAG: hypothetical protein ACOYMF_13590 [Bacteroidales bacterium]